MAFGCGHQVKQYFQFRPIFFKERSNKGVLMTSLFLLHDRHVVNVDKIFSRVPSVEAPLTPELSFTRRPLPL